jgi:hypothetical protein
MIHDQNEKNQQWELRSLRGQTDGKGKEVGQELRMRYGRYVLLEISQSPIVDLCRDTLVQLG